MKIDIEGIFAAIARAEESFEVVRQMGDTIALVLANGGQAELQERLAQLRAENDAARARRHEKLAHAAKS